MYFWKTPSGQTPDKGAKFQTTIDTSTTLHLEAFTSYRFQVVAYNSVGDGPASNVVGPLTTPESGNDFSFINLYLMGNSLPSLSRWQVVRVDNCHHSKFTGKNTGEYSLKSR